MSAAPVTAEMGATAALVAFACDPAPRGTAATRAAVKDLIVDTVGVAAAGGSTPATALLRSWVDEQYPAQATADAALHPGSAALWGESAGRGPADAALINGTAAHALDWDDAAPSMAMHPAAVLLPTLFALTGRHPATGPDLEEAYCVGSAVFRAVSEALPHGVHYGRGWHNTSTTGRLAATAAAARLVGLTPEQTAHALGIAASAAAGSLANFGTMTKPMHAGLTARDAVMAVGLAQRGFTANPAQLESRGGFFDLFGDHDPARTATLSERLTFWATGWVDDYAIKAYPSCFATQRAIDAGFSLRNELGAGVSQISRLSVTLEAGGLRPLRDSEPTSGLEAKFSLEYTLSVALLTGNVRLSDFTDEAVADPEVAALMRRVELAERPPSSEPGFTVVNALLDGGRELVRQVHHSRGDSHNPLQRHELADKFLQCVGDQRDEASCLAWFDELHALADVEVPQTWQALLAGPPLRP